MSWVCFNCSLALLIYSLNLEYASSFTNVALTSKEWGLIFSSTSSFLYLSLNGLIHFTDCWKSHSVLLKGFFGDIIFLTISGVLSELICNISAVRKIEATYNKFIFESELCSYCWSTSNELWIVNRSSLCDLHNLAKSLRISIDKEPTILLNSSLWVLEESDFWSNVVSQLLILSPWLSRI